MSAEIRVCKTCGVGGLLINFPKDGKDKNGNQKYGGSCRTCKNAYNKVYKQKIKERNQNIVDVYENIKEKYCGVCGIIKPSIEFNKDITAPDGLDYCCRGCKNEYKRSLYNKIKYELQNGIRDFIEITEKKCSSCKTVKPIEEMTKSIGSVDRYSYICKQCAIIFDNVNRDRLKKLFENNKMVYKEVQEKVCSFCGINKNINEFSTDRWSVDNHTSQCKSCINARVNPEWYRNYYQENREKILEDIRMNGVIKRKQLRQEIIKKSGDKDRNTILYILKFTGYGVEYLKIGITRISIYERYKNGYGGFEYDILHESYHTYRKARALEQLLLQDHRGCGLGYEYPVELKNKFAGWTECISKLHKGILENYGMQINYDKLNDLGLLCG